MQDVRGVDGKTGVVFGGGRAPTEGRGAAAGPGCTRMVHLGLIPDGALAEDVEHVD
jgi:hypothetical protein